MQNKQYILYILIYYCIVQRNFRCQTMKVKPYIILNTSRKHVNYEEDKNKVYNIQNTNIYNGIFNISFFKALLINEGETTQIPVLRSHLNLKDTFYLSCRRKLHMNWTSFKRLPVLKHNFEPVEKIISEKLDELKGAEARYSKDLTLC